jgi:hypothetical protein
VMLIWRTEVRVQRGRNLCTYIDTYCTCKLSCALKRNKIETNNYHYFSNFYLFRVTYVVGVSAINKCCKNTNKPLDVPASSVVGGKGPTGCAKLKKSHF